MQVPTGIPSESRDWQTAEARKYWGIKKSSAKDALTPESHANDALAMLNDLFFRMAVLAKKYKNEMFGDNVDNSCIFMVWRRSRESGTLVTSGREPANAPVRG